jgi:glutamate/tyrosine decarboxylase-like PLP-dependent enzyme
MDERSPIDLDPEEFRALGHQLVDDLAGLLERLPELPVTPGESSDDVRAALGDVSLPQHGAPPEELLAQTRDLLFEHSLFTGHPRFLGYVIGAPAPLAALADLLAAGINPNLGVYPLAPFASESERQTVQWVAVLIGYRPDCGGILVSGGNMANFIGVLAARRAKAPWVREQGMGDSRLRLYATDETHTWIDKALDMFGFGTEGRRLVPVDGSLRMDGRALRNAIAEDRADGFQPFLVIANGGAISTGIVDPLREIGALCREEDLWFHVDGAYGAFAAAAPSAPDDLRALAEADSIALDPHKWLFMPAEAGCALVRSDQDLLDTFDFTPPYYKLGEDELHYYKRGPQNSRGFRALKVWLSLRHLGREGYAQLIERNIALARELDALVDAAPDLELGPGGLSVTNFRYVPEGIGSDEELNALNTEILGRLQRGGEVFVSNSLLDGRYWLRSCIVNFRTTRADLETLVGVVQRLGAEALARA